MSPEREKDIQIDNEVIIYLFNFNYCNPFRILNANQRNYSANQTGFCSADALSIDNELDDCTVGGCLNLAKNDTRNSPQLN